MKKKENYYTLFICDLLKIIPDKALTVSFS